MRAKEFISEAKVADNIPDFAEPVLDRMMMMPDMDPYYEYYRFMTMTAGEPEVKIDPAGTLRNVPAALAYSKEEMTMLNNALKRMGRKAEFVTGPGSQEPKGTHNTSPVAQVKKNKYGV